MSFSDTIAFTSILVKLWFNLFPFCGRILLRREVLQLFEISELAISSGGVLVSCILSWIIARTTVNGEIKKMKLSWKHDDASKSSDEFSQMVSAVILFCANRTSSPIYRDACSKVAAMSSKEEGRVASELDRLNKLLANYASSDAIKRSLNTAIDLKRKKTKANKI